MSITQSQPLPAPPFVPAEVLPDYEQFITEDDKPVDSMYCERQHRLLLDALFASWVAPQGRAHWAATDVGVFYSVNEPAVAPDVFLSLDVNPPTDLKTKKGRSYFCWLAGKCPDLTVEVVSNLEGGELSDKMEKYALIGIPHFVVWDPQRLLSQTPLQCFALNRKKYVACEPWFPELDLGVAIWDGAYQQMNGPWLRFCDREGRVLPTGVERAVVAEQRADSAELQAAKLADKLRALGVDPDSK